MKIQHIKNPDWWKTQRFVWIGPTTGTPESQPAASAAPAVAPPVAHQQSPEKSTAKAEVRADTQAQLSDLQTDIANFQRTVEAASDASEGAKKTVQERLQSFLSAEQSDAPAQFRQEWRNAAISYMEKEMASWAIMDGNPLKGIGTMDNNDANVAVDGLINPQANTNSREHGPGAFETWFASAHPAEYKQWQEEKEKTPAEEMPPNRPETVQAKPPETPAVTTAPAAPADTTPSDQELEAAAIDAADGPPKMDTFKSWVKSWAGEGKFKEMLVSIAKVVTSILVSVCKFDFIGNKLRGDFISNEDLDKAGDETAKLAVVTEKQFRKFGLPKKLANKLGPQKTSDVVATLTVEVPKMDAADSQKSKLEFFLSQLKKRGGATSEQTLFEFTNTEAWQKDLKFKPDTTSASAEVVSSGSAQQTSSQSASAESGPTSPTAPGPAPAGAPSTTQGATATTAAPPPKA